MTEVMVVLCTFPDAEKARQIGTHLVERQYAACVNLLPGVESIYSWEGKMCKDTEILAVFKTKRSTFAQLSAELKALHPYDQPEILALPVADGDAGYLRWVSDQAGA
ncbi:MAG: divalent-cation tolerance protein CutA [Akkermansiaceae bacterium]